jgi:hypothetical protein
MKFAGKFRGADRSVAEAIGFSEFIPQGDWRILETTLPARRVLFLGVGNLYDFRYERIREFTRTAFEIIVNRNGLKPSIVGLTIHGPGYGLDEGEAFLSMISGIHDFFAKKNCNSFLKEIAIVERNAKLAEKLRGQLIKFEDEIRTHKPRNIRERMHILDEDATHYYGAVSEKKARLFVAMPFIDKWMDEYLISISEAASSNGFLAERLDMESYVGDVVSKIKNDIGNSSGVIALLNERNPNVYLEVGYALAKKKPTILVIKAGQKPAFDLAGQKIVVYKNIFDLRTTLTKEIENLKEKGVF